MYGSHAIEHGSTRSGRWLRARRFRLTLWIAAVEGLLYLLGVVSWWLVVVLAAIGILFYLYAGRTSRSDLLRQVSWIFAFSQTLVLVVPLAFWLVKLLAIGIVVLLAIAGLIYLFTERPK
jgi:hypothetical protein